MDRITEKCWRNLDLWEMCGQDKYCKRGCHVEGGCTNGCIVPRLYVELAKHEDAIEEGRELQFPVKIGSTVYEIYNNTDCCCNCDQFITGYCFEDFCKKVLINNPQNYKEPVCDKQVNEIRSVVVDLDWLLKHKDEYRVTWFETEEVANYVLNLKRINRS